MFLLINYFFKHIFQNNIVDFSNLEKNDSEKIIPNNNQTLLKNIEEIIKENCNNSTESYCLIQFYKIRREMGLSLIAHPLGKKLIKKILFHSKKP